MTVEKSLEANTLTLEFDYFRLMRKCGNGGNTILEIEHLGIAVICCIHLLQSLIFAAFGSWYKTQTSFLF